MNLNRSAQQMFEGCLGDRDRYIVSKIVMPIHQNIHEIKSFIKNLIWLTATMISSSKNTSRWKCYDRMTAYREFEAFLERV